jgi:hypothetical protein
MLASGAMHESSGFFQPCPAGDILSKSAAALNSSFFAFSFSFLLRSVGSWKTLPTPTLMIRPNDA